MRFGAWRLEQAGAAAVAIVALLAAGAALAAGSLTKHNRWFFSIAPGHTRNSSVSYPDALRYANATYSGRGVVLAPSSGATGRAPNLKKVKILFAGSVLGGSSYEVRAHNGNSPDTAAVRLEIIATTVEMLPHR